MLRGRRVKCISIAGNALAEESTEGSRARSDPAFPLISGESFAGKVPLFLSEPVSRQSSTDLPLRSMNDFRATLPHRVCILHPLPPYGRTFFSHSLASVRSRALRNATYLTYLLFRGVPRVRVASNETLLRYSLNVTTGFINVDHRSDRRSTHSLRLSARSDIDCSTETRN